MAEPSVQGRIYSVFRNALTAGFFTRTRSNTKRFNIAGQHRQLVSNGFP